MALTGKQAAVLAFIDSFRSENGCSPSIRDIQAHFRLASTFGVRRHLLALERKGLLSRTEGRARSLVTKSSQDHLRIPLMGAIPAGFPVDHDQSGEAYVSLDPSSLGLPKSAALFALRVTGDSMIGAHILDGDLAVFEQKPGAHLDIVAALIDGEVTLKRLIIEGTNRFLRAENPAYPNLIPARELIVQGVLRTLIRNTQKFSASL